MPAKNTSWSGKRESFTPKKRRAILKRDRVCKACGHCKSMVADHVVPVVEARRMGWSETRIHSLTNGQGLCGSCHDVKTNQERLRGLKRVTRKRAPESHPGIVASN